MFTLTIASFLQGMLAFIFVGLCLLLCLVILIQKPKGGGLSGAFGGAGGGSQMFGGKTGDMLTWITVGFFVCFLLVGMLLIVETRKDARGMIKTVPSLQPVPAAAPLNVPEGTNPDDLLKNLPPLSTEPGTLPGPVTPAVPAAPETPATPETPAPPATPTPEPGDQPGQ